jgi:hypothetical protein
VGLELLLAGALALAVLYLRSALRRERRQREAGHRPQTHPFFLGIYRGCTVAIVLDIVLSVVLSILRGPPPSLPN